jgi:hypothetical protein
MRQVELLKKEPKAYGGELLKTRAGRQGPRPLVTRDSMHLVLRSSKAVGQWSFKRPHHAAAIRRIVSKFAGKYGVKIFSQANVGNHLHLHIQLTNRYTYRPFIRAITAAIAMAVTGASRWRPLNAMTKTGKARFWDYRPFTRVMPGYRAFLRLRDYIRINMLEGFGEDRAQASFTVAWDAASRRRNL